MARLMDRLTRGARPQTCLLLALLAAPFTYGCEANLMGLDPESAKKRAQEEAEAPTVWEKPILPGYSVIRRLSGLEYNNTVRDLLGTSLRPADNFPADDLGSEFATVGASLSLSPLYVLALEQAAHDLSSELFAEETRGQSSIISCDVEVGELLAANTCATKILTDFLPRAFRRPVTQEEINVLLGPYRLGVELGATRTESLRHSLAAVFLSPHFLFKVETDQEPDSGKARILTSHEVATRLSYALWATTPDEELTKAAESGLTSQEAVAEQISRMLKDERASGFLDNFVSYWLGYTNLDAHEVEATAFPNYSPELARSMMQEAHAFVREFLLSDMPVSEMLDAKFTFLNAELAEHYGVPFDPSNATDSEMTADGLIKTELSQAPRAGLLTLGAVLTTTSFSTRTSPVRRGEYVFNRLLCGEIPPPPPGVEGFEGDATGLSMRQRLELHRADPSCSSCHDVMDPLGLGLENYDAVGAYREMDAGLAVDASGELPDGSTFEGAVELSAVLAENPDFTDCVTQKFMTYAIGRVFTHKDEWTRYLVQQMPEEDLNFTELLSAVLLSDAFLSRQAGKVQ